MVVDRKKQSKSERASIFRYQEDKKYFSKSPTDESALNSFHTALKEKSLESIKMGSVRKVVDCDKNRQKEEDSEQSKEKYLEKIHLYRSIPVLVIAGFLLVFSIYLVTPSAILKEINISGNQKVQTEKILMDSAIRTEDYTLTILLNAASYEQNIQKSSPWIEKVMITYKFPITFNIDIKEYDVVAYNYLGGKNYPVISNGEQIPDPLLSDTCPSSYIQLHFFDQQMTKKLIQKLNSIDSVIKKNIHSVHYTPSAATNDLLTFEMYDGNKILIPLSDINRKLPYYTNISVQLAERSIIDMEAGVYSFVN